MTSPFANYPAPERTFITANPGTPTPRGRGRGGTPGAKRGRKPRGGASLTADSYTHTPSPLSQQNNPSQSQSQSQNQGLSRESARASVVTTSLQWTQPTMPVVSGSQVGVEGSAHATGSQHAAVAAAAAGVVLPSNAQAAVGQKPGASGAPGAEEDAEGEDEVLPAMADDDYSTLASWQSQSKDNLKVLMDNFTPEQYERFEAYRRHALPKQAVRKVIQQTLGQQVSQPVAQVVAGFSKVFVGEIVEKARAVQARRGDTGPLSPDHLREAYRMYQEETGRVGAARPVRSKRLFMR
ncbi:hypothetical protein EW146_g8793 [Bondarzewia mesenterica]|uniref:Transcription initiation factor TFIID subunit 11 n=1 Tax=Bondarzewia mesenterica TaxID=1095465 RepID=A0A4V3XDB3_9AGAM|nr:hypothetical protein EW146_g8793 [Bondarzewia mesenterica]